MFILTKLSKDNTNGGVLDDIKVGLEIISTFKTLEEAQNKMQEEFDQACFDADLGDFNDDDKFEFSENLDVLGYSEDGYRRANITEVSAFVTEWDECGEGYEYTFEIHKID